MFFRFERRYGVPMYCKCHYRIAPLHPYLHPTFQKDRLPENFNLDGRVRINHFMSKNIPGKTSNKRHQPQEPYDELPTSKDTPSHNHIITLEKNRDVNTIYCFFLSGKPRLPMRALL